jgi:hypothetical protein
VAFLIQRNADGTMPKDIAEASEAQLEQKITRNLLGMMWHNVHRINEGGGYADVPFEQDLEEAKEKVMQWPVVSARSTELLRGDIAEMEKILLEKGEGAEVSELRSPLGRARNEKRPVKTHLSATLHRLGNAIGREEQNYATYPEADLRGVETLLKKSIAERMQELNALRKEIEEKRLALETMK